MAEWHQTLLSWHDSDFGWLYSYRPKYDGFLNMIEETGPNMEMDIKETNTDIDYGNIGKSQLNPTRNGGEGSF